jgi:quinol-cytochrome oxidoreductase complex cytochrome b subunit
MSAPDFVTFLACAVVVFVLASCIHRKHVRRPHIFFWALGFFIAGLVIHDLWSYVRPTFPFGPMSGTAPASSASDILVYFSRWLMYASLPLFFIACTGSPKAFPQCSSCGYNLTGNDSGVCPECGRDLTSGSK